MRIELEGGGVRLAGHLCRPPDGSANASRGLVLCHAFPSGPGGSATSGQTYPEFAERLVADTGWTVLTFNFRGAGASEGDFSLSGWLTDLHTAIDHLLATEPVTDVWLAGAGTGGSLAICAAAEDERVRGVAALGAHADFKEWATDPERFLAHARAIGVIRDPAFPPDPDRWARELVEIRPVAVIANAAPRQLLLVHGADDDVVHVQDARWLADSTDGRAELCIVRGAGHRLRHDPRAVAILIGWMARQSAGPASA